MSKKFEIYYEATPNPQAMKFNVAADIANESVFFDDATKTARSPLAQKLFGFPWMKAVFIGPNYITITKQDWVEWSVLADPLSDLIGEHLERGEGVVLKLTPADSSAGGGGGPASASSAGSAAGGGGSASASSGSSAADIHPDDSPIVVKIKEILNQEIRPAVAMDGGDIVFSHYDENRLFLHMQGSCVGCPSSQITLKQGIEARLKEAIPELIEVIAL